jgi:hypothetical protein
MYLAISTDRDTVSNTGPDELFPVSGGVPVMQTPPPPPAFLLRFNIIERCDGVIISLEYLGDIRFKSCTGDRLFLFTFSVVLLTSFCFLLSFLLLITLQTCCGSRSTLNYATTLNYFLDTSYIKIQKILTLM